MEKTPDDIVSESNEIDKTALSPEKQHKKEILDAWRAEKRAKRQLRRERLNARPLWQKIISKIIIGIVILAAAAGAFMLAGGIDLIIKVVVDYYQDNIYAIENMSTEEIRKDCVIDQDAADKIASMPGYGADDTWAIYIYMVGSDLESWKENDLSEMVNEISERAIKENSETDERTRKEQIDAYLSAIEKADMELPSPMYVSKRPAQASSVPVTTDVVKTDQDGAASNDIREILEADISDNIDIVIQTGGARRWDNYLINPNRIQRFHVSDHGLVEEWSEPSECMATTDSLADFLSYCDKNHDADHKFIIFWNHGGASMGYGLDEVYDRMLSLKEMKQAFARVYGENPEEPPFELIGFDACLMTASEALDTFENYGRYYVGSEETEPGYGWYYTRWLGNLALDPGMNGAQLGREIVDEYMDFYKAQDVKISQISGLNNVCLSVLDLKEAGKVYDEYENFIRKVITDTQDDPGALTDVSKAAHESIHYAAPYNEIYNTVDLGIMMENLSDRYPEDSAKIKDMIAKSVLYNRTANNMTDSQGVSVYFPDTVTKKKSVIKMMNYIENITDDDAVKALYFYKSAGCLTDDMRASLDGMGVTLDNINTDALRETSAAEPSITKEGGYTLSVSKETLKYMQDYRFSLGACDDDTEEITDYGSAYEPVIMDDDGNLSVDFDGKWPCIGGQPLACEIIQRHGEITTFRSSILLDGEEAYLVYSYDDSDGKFDISGAYLEENVIEGDYVGRNISDLKPGCTITPVYDCNSSTEGIYEKNGKDVKYTTETKVCYESLPNGAYCSAVVFSDVRGDEFDSIVVQFKENGGKISDTDISSDIVLMEE